MDDVDRLIERVGDVRCASCGGRLTRAAVRGVGYESDCWLVYVTCLACGNQCVGMAITAPGGSAPSATGPQENALESDDVLDAHEFLRRYAGDVHGLFAAPRKRALR